MNNVALRSSYFPLSPSRPTERNKVGPGEQAPKEGGGGGEGGRSPIPPSLLFLSFRMLIIPISPSPQPGNGGMPTPPSPPPPPPPTPASEIHQGREESFATHLSLSGETEGEDMKALWPGGRTGRGDLSFMLRGRHCRTTAPTPSPHRPWVHTVRYIFCSMWWESLLPSLAWRGGQTRA